MIEERLSISSYSVQGGLCLVSRLKRLERLQLHFALCSYDKKKNIVVVSIRRDGRGESEAVEHCRKLGSAAERRDPSGRRSTEQQHRSSQYDIGRRRCNVELMDI